MQGCRFSVLLMGGGSSNLPWSWRVSGRRSVGCTPGEGLVSWLILEPAWLLTGLWGICLGPWNPVRPPCVSPTPTLSLTAVRRVGGASWQLRDLQIADSSGAENGGLCENAGDACTYTIFPGNRLASLPCILPPTKISRDQSISLWGADHWWFIWGSPAKWSQCFTGFHQSIASAFPPLSCFTSQY